jgi:Holliday junction resolvase-like predicted endonuclease
MMGGIAAWGIDSAGPCRLTGGQVDLERDLEEWIERDPRLVQSGLTIVGRQVRTEGGPLDLLAIDPQGRWVVIEIKRGRVMRDTITQALDYASCIARMPIEQLRDSVNAYLSARGEPEALSLDAIMQDRQGGVGDSGDPRAVDIIVVGTGRDPSLERITSFLAGSGDVAITVVSFDVFQTAQEARILVRELTESDVPETPTKASLNVEDVYQRAKAKGTEARVKRIVETGLSLGLHPRAWKTSIMLAPPARKTRCLVTVWTDPSPRGSIRVYVAAEAFGEFYGIAPDHVTEALRPQPDGYLELQADQVDGFTHRLRGLLCADDAEAD